MTLTQDLFKRNSILFESYFGNILFLKKEDVEFLHATCAFYFDPDDMECMKKFKETTLNSPLYDMLHKESKVKLKETPRVYWEAESFDPNKKDIGIMVASTNGYVLEDSKKYVLSKMLHPERIMIFLPLILDWAQYYLPKSINDSLYARQVLYSIQQVLRNQSTLRELIMVNVPNEISIVVKEPHDR
jgi:hypothetical protein